MQGTAFKGEAKAICEALENMCDADVQAAEVGGCRMLQTAVVPSNC